MKTESTGKFPPLSLGTKAAGAVIILLTVVAVILGALFGCHQRRSLMDHLHEKTVSFARNLAFNCNFALLSRNMESLNKLIAGVRLEKDVTLVLVTDSLGRVVAATDSALNGTLLSCGFTATAPDSTSWLQINGSSRYRAIAPVVTDNASSYKSDESMFFAPGENQRVREGEGEGLERLGYAVIEVSLDRMNRELSKSLRNAILTFLLMLVLASLLAIISVRRITAPLHLLADATKVIAGGDFGRTIPSTRRDELGVLSESFNEMSLKLKKTQDEFEHLNGELEYRITESTTELRNRYKELETVCADLKNLDSAKNDFLSLVSHEFRTPLGSIQLFSEMLLKGLDRSDTRRTDFLMTIISNCRRLTRLINEVLDITRIEAGKMQFSHSFFDLREAVYETVFSLKPLFEERSLSCRFNSPEEKVTVNSDRDRIIQVITNILSNAIRFSPPGQTVEIDLDAPDGRVTVAVRDHGRGMRPEDIPKIFDKYTQLERLRPENEGSGLGMTIAKMILDNLGGTIRVDSAVGRGTCVTFSLAEAKPEENSGV